MHCNKFIGETIVHKEWLLDRSVVLAQVLSYKHLDEPLDNTHGIYRQQINYMHAKLQAYLESIWRVWQCIEARGKYSMNTL